MADPLPQNVHISTHPCVKAKLSQLRSTSTEARATKTLVHEIATIVGCEALAHGLTTRKAGKDTSPLGYEYDIDIIAPSRICLVPILRSGLSMIDALESLLPSPVPVHHLGMYREKSTLQPVEYYNNLPYHKAGGSTTPPDLAIIIDPIIATGQTICAAIDTLQDYGVKRIIAIAVLASEGGIRQAAERGDVEIWAGGLDPLTDDRGMIKPGLGDIGDRLFLTLGK